MTRKKQLHRCAAPLIGKKIKKRKILKMIKTKPSIPGTREDQKKKFFKKKKFRDKKKEIKD